MKNENIIAMGEWKTQTNGSSECGSVEKNSKIRKHSF